MKRVLIYLGIGLLAFNACDDIIEEEIDGKQVKINSPADQLQTTNPTILFWWEEVEHADDYQLEVVRGRFDSVVQFVLDTVLSARKFEYTFNPGNYQWRLKARNSVSSTTYLARSFQIDSTKDLSLAKVNLQYPVNSILIGNGQPTFRWNSLASATSYQFELRQPNWNGSTVYADRLDTTSLAWPDTLPTSTYEWGVVAINNQSASTLNRAVFEVDITAPGKPTLELPANAATVSKSNGFILRWKSGLDGNYDYDSLWVYSDAALTNLVFDTLYRGTVFSDTLLSNISVGNTYYWRVKTIDKVNNKGEYSTAWQFSLN
jgi:hypothetical protein